MSDLKQELVKLGNSNPELQPSIREVLAATGKTAASEIDISEVPPECLALAKILKVEIKQAFDGIHGHILVCMNSSRTGRLTSPILKKLTASRAFRWIEADEKDVVIGC